MWVTGELVPSHHIYSNSGCTGPDDAPRLVQQKV